MDYSILENRRKEMQEVYDNLPLLEQLYYNLAEDIAFLTVEQIKQLENSKPIKEDLKKQSKSIAEFDRDYRMTNEYHIIKCTELMINAIEKMSFAVNQRRKGLEIEQNRTIN